LTSLALNAQTYREYLPDPGLADLVSCVWVQRVSRDAAPYEHRTVPNGCVELTWVVGGEEVSVVGPRRRAVVDRVAPGCAVAGLRFRPGVPHEVLGATACELLGAGTTLDVLWGDRAARASERIHLAPTPEAVVRILQREVLARRAAAPGPDALVAEIIRRLQPWRRGEVRELASDLFVSPRQLRRRCIAAFGFGPKTLQRILRFQGFLALAQDVHRPDAGLSRLAAAAGYFDQAHLTRECRALTELTPAAFVREMRASCGENHDHGASFAVPRRALAGRPLRPSLGDACASSLAAL
jgi:AraC-like DNA-binding protein